MIKRLPVSVAALCRYVAITGSFGIMLPTIKAQTPAASAADLAKYDKNKNGVLDAAELAQKASDESKEKDTILMTPFEVSTEKDVGYAAGNTLSGGRVDTPLAITPGSISVMTKEFMEDFNITNMNEAGAWMIGFDLGTAVPNSNPASDSVYQNIVRGAPATDNFPTRNGTINFGAADSYNTERFEFQRGPDTSMFGDGGPGGRQGSTGKRARLNSTATSLSTQFDSWNGYRHTLDYGKGWDRFGIRLNVLTQNAPGYQSGENKLKKGVTITTTTQLTKNTSLYVTYERMNDWNNLWSITNGDAQLAWDGNSINDDNNNLASLNTTQLNALGLDLNRTFIGFGAPSNASMWIYNYALGNLQDYGGNNYRTRAAIQNLRIPYRGNPYLKAIPSRRAPIPQMDPRFSFAPKDNIAARDADTLEAALEQRVGNLFVQLKFTKNDFDNNTIWSNTSPNNYLIDVNKLQPNGQLNPKFMHPFTDVEQNNLYSQDAIVEYQALATYRFFKPRWWDYKQQISLTVSRRETQNENNTRAWRRTDNPKYVAGSNTFNDPYNDVNKLFYRVYWDDPRADLAPIFTDPNKTLPGTWAYVENVGGAVNGSTNGITKRKLDHYGLTEQSAFWNEKIAITGSYSRDGIGVDLLPPLAANLAGTTGAAGGYKSVLGYNGVAGAHYKRTGWVSSSAVGAVVYPFQFKNDGVLKTFLSPVGFVFNFAENTQPPGTAAQAPLINGELPPLTHSRTRDFGLRYSVPGGKAYFTLSHYKTDQIDNPSGFGSRTDIQNIWKALGYTDPVLTTNFIFSDPSSRQLEGWEMELTANPTRNITLSINYSHPLVYIVRESEDRKLYVAANLAEWTAGIGGVAKGPNGLVAGADGPTGIIQTNLNTIQNDLNGLATGTLQDGSERHRINATAAYRWREGMLKGLGVNAGVQYRGHIKSGSRDPQIHFGRTDAEVATGGSKRLTAAENLEAAHDYLWTKGYWKNSLTAGANYTRRFGKYNWRFQVNVTNLLNDLEPIWGRSGLGNNAYIVVGTNALNAGNARTQFLYSFTNPDPRKFTFTTTVSF